jgi:hypothetical protein
MLVTDTGFERLTTNSKSLDLQVFLDTSTAR